MLHVNQYQEKVEIESYKQLKMSIDWINKPLALSYQVSFNRAIDIKMPTGYFVLIHIATLACLLLCLVSDMPGNDFCYTGFGFDRFTPLEVNFSYLIQICNPFKE